MLVAVIQSSFVLVVRNESKAMVDHAARALTRPSANPPAIIQSTRRSLTAITGDADVEITYAVGSDTYVVARFDWTPPGPSWGSVDLRVESTAYPVIVP